MGEFETLDRRPLYARVADSILSLIAEGGLRPGDELPSEAELCDRAGVSRVVVRGALAHLAGAGHIKIANGRKAQVTAINPDILASTFRQGLATDQFSVGKVIELRRGIEGATAGLAAQNRTEKQVETLATLCDQMAQTQDTPEVFADLDYLFHLTIAEATDNPLYVYIVTPLRSVITQSITAGHLAQPSELAQRRILADHRAILKAIAERNPEAATKAMQAHFSAASEALQQSKAAPTAGPTP